MKGAFISIVIALMVLGCDTFHDTGENYQPVLFGLETESEYVDFLNENYELGPGNINYIAFVVWGIDYPEKFISVTENHKLTEKSLHLLGYTISDIGYSDHFCAHTKKYKDGSGEYKIQSLFLGCN